jgi:transposase-like protein
MALAAVRASQDELERAVAQALLNGASVRAVAESGLSPNTVQKYGRAHGWPTELNRARFYESRWDRDERESGG